MRLRLLAPLTVFAALIIAVFSQASPSAAQTTSVSEPSRVVEAFHSVLLGVMKEADQLGKQGRFDRLEPAIEDAFQLEITFRQAVGRSAWRSADRAIRERALTAFRHWTAATYADRFDGYSGQSFVTVEERDGPRPGTRLVETRIEGIKDKKPVVLTYVMLKVRDRWGIYDVLLQQGATRVSQLAKSISEFKAPLKAGLANLADDLETRTKTLTRVSG